MSIFKQQAMFMKACGQTVNILNASQAALYSELVNEEYREFWDENVPEYELKELMDCLVVLIGYGLSQGWDLDGAWEEVWRSNMSKIDKATGTVLKRADGKVLKPESYIPADVSKFI